MVDFCYYDAAGAETQGGKGGERVDAACCVLNGVYYFQRGGCDGCLYGAEDASLYLDCVLAQISVLYRLDAGATFGCQCWGGVCFVLAWVKGIALGLNDMEIEKRILSSQEKAWYNGHPPEQENTPSRPFHIQCFHTSIRRNN